MSNELEQLCERVGVLTEYKDAWGNRQAPPRDSIVALLAQLGISADSAEAMAQAERDAIAREMHEVLPSLYAVTAGHRRWAIPLRLIGHAPERITWTVTEEGGRKHEGSALTSALPRRKLEEGAVEYELPVGIALPAGYHRLTIANDPAAHTQLVAAPPHCHEPEALQGDGRLWGPAVQLYSLRSERNWGMGDFGDLAEAIDQWAARGAGLIGLNPLHAMFAHNPSHASPYGPSSRLQLNTIYLDVEAVDDFHECGRAQSRVRSPVFQERLAELRATGLVDYVGVAACKNEILALLYEHFCDQHIATDTERARAFRAFQRERGAALRAHAGFEALQVHFHANDSAVWGWPAWPAAYRDPASPEVQQFIQAHERELAFYEYLQWQADLQLAQLNRRCCERGMPAGLYLDLAVSVDRAGSDAWAHQEAYANGASVGAPPDEVNPNGQGWGLLPLRPASVKRDVRLFVDTLRAVMRHAGAVRIDHVMGLMRLYWIAGERSPRDGSYVLYPLRELISIVALESVRNRCIVIGEDLGTVAEQMREAMREKQLLSYRLLYFEREHDGLFKAPAAYPKHALVAVSTHDLATLAGWWGGHDLELRKRLDLFPRVAMYGEQRQARAQDRFRLLGALRHAGLLPDGLNTDAAAEQPMTPALAEAIHAYAARTPSQVMLVQLEDALGVVEQPNLPGTVDEHPNWRRKLPMTLERMAHDERVNSLAARLSTIRPRPEVLREAEGARTQAVIPRATYRLQLHQGFTFDDALRVLPYLKRLGVSHVYCSPIMRARPGSVHGYDIVSHAEINPELGGRTGFERFSNALRAHGLGLLLDVVPNHMGVLGADNPWWMDVLENGAASIYSRHFDIDWQPANRDLHGKVLVPVLGEPYGDALASGALKLRYEPDIGGFAVCYHTHRFPLDPRSYPEVLAHVQARLSSGRERNAIEALGDDLHRLPAGSADDAARARDKDGLKARLATLVREQPLIAAAVDSAVAAINGDNTHDTLHALHEAQHYRLAYWRVAADEVNYRRFFDINELAALRIEDYEVFEATHRLPLELAAAGLVDGLRIDHPDGLRDPATYFRRLQQGYAERAGIAQSDAHARPLYVVAEKIAAPHEDMPDSWAIHGTTGYRFAMVAGGVLVDTNAAERFDRIWMRFSGRHESFEELAYAAKRKVARGALASELTLLTNALVRIADADRRTRDYTANTLRDALAEIAACMPVYRTYVVDGPPSAQDQRFIDWAVAHARRHSDAADTSVFDFVRRLLLGQDEAGQTLPADSPAWAFAARFQQFCAPVAAKGVEDTAFYRYGRLASLNEVGGNPAQFGLTVRAFHGANTDRAARWPHTILATSTHDNKRSEDVRNRLHVLSEMPAAWRLSLSRWRRMSRVPAAAAESGTPSRADEYLLYQTLLGTLPADGLSEGNLPAFRERIQQYMLKAAREAKLYTSWTAPDETYENALTAFINTLLARVQPNPLLSDLQSSASTLAWFGALNSLVMTLIKFTAPGVPDLYQGNELMDLSLVDPDNRRPVDYAARSQWLESLESLAQREGPALSVAELARWPHDGRAKLWVTWRLLQHRAQHEALFRDGRYVALSLEGEQQQQALGYARQLGGQTLIVMSGRLFSQLPVRMGELPVGERCWSDTTVDLSPIELADGARLVDLLSGHAVAVQGGKLRLADAFACLPLAAFAVDA